MAVLSGLVVFAVGLVQASPASATGAIYVDLGLVEVRDVAYVDEADRIVVVGDDEAQIYTSDGVLTATITPLSGALQVESAGPYAVVAAPGTGELVVIDVRAGTVVRRIFSRGQRITSISVAGDNIWFIHHDGSSAYVGLASLSRSDLSSQVGEFHNYRGTIASSQGRPNVGVYDSAQRRSARPRDDLITSRDPVYPFVVDDAGEMIYGVESGNLIQIDASSLQATGVVFDQPMPGASETPAVSKSLAIQGQTIAYGWGRSVVLVDTADPEFGHTIDIRGWVNAVDLGEDAVYLTHGGAGSPTVLDQKSKLTISPLDYVEDPIIVDIWVDAYGEVPDGTAPELRIRCSDLVERFTVPYGVHIAIEAAPNETSCSFKLFEPKGLRATSVYTSEGAQPDGNEIRVVLSGDRSEDGVGFIHEFDSVFNDPATFVKQQYRDLLDREPTESELAVAVDRLASRQVSFAGLVSEVVEGRDFLGSVAPVSRLYLAYFGRWPDEQGLSYWLGRSRDGQTIEAASAFFASSPEFGQRYGVLDDAGFVRLVYRNVLGREPEDSGFQFWMEQLGAGLSRGDLMTGFSESPENVANLQSRVAVRSLYHGLLGREPDKSGAAFWVGQYEQGHSIEGMVVGFLESAEYFDRFWWTDPVLAGVWADLSIDEQVVRPADLDSRLLGGRSND